ncbi:hypothetical protein BC628DRAFT_897485 [Trametes gibbosa]|nr:hypothetical protein BC628DRAFT_897485 [Trametes gibbosa]
MCRPLQVFRGQIAEPGHCAIERVSWCIVGWACPGSCLWHGVRTDAPETRASGRHDLIEEPASLRHNALAHLPGPAPHRCGRGGPRSSTDAARRTVERGLARRSRCAAQGTRSCARERGGDDILALERLARRSSPDNQCDHVQAVEQPSRARVMHHAWVNAQARRGPAGGLAGHGSVGVRMRRGRVRVREM